MRKVHGKSVILGIGMGMIITAIAGLIYTGGGVAESNQNMSREEIIRLAKTYGMVESVHILDDDTIQNTAPNTSSAVSSGAGTTSETTDDQRNITIVIKSGFDSIKVIDILYEKGIISDKKKFEAVMNSLEATTKITSGTFNFKKNDNYEYVVKTICNIK